MKKIKILLILVAIILIVSFIVGLVFMFKGQKMYPAQSDEIDTIAKIMCYKKVFNFS